jgi:stage V sporulation protein AE
MNFDVMEYVIPFVVGGAVCALVQILMEKTKLMPGRIMVLLVCTGAILGFFGLYEPFANFSGTGATVPLLGFGHTLWKGMKMSIDEYGLLGLFKGGLTAGAVGISAAMIFGYIASWIFKPAMKKR